MVALIELIRKGTIPRNQYMDLETLNWIKKNRPSFNLDDELDLSIKSGIEKSLSLIESFIPLVDWFLVLKKKDTIHGMRHIIRVIIHSFFLLDVNKEFSPKYLKNALVAASIHDLRRRTDLMDINHGKRAARWFKNNVKLVEDEYEIQFSDNDIEEIFYAIHFHNTPYETIVSTENYQKYKILTDILKTADAMDRYRLPSLRLWIKEKYLSYIPPDQIKQIAYKLVVSSETKFLEGLSNKESVLSTIKELFQ